jgi:sensor histidine kinase YesM
MTTLPDVTFPAIAPFGGTQYTILQAGFWLLITGLMCIAITSGPPTRMINEFDPTTRMIVLEKMAVIKPSRWVDTFTLPLTGLILTHALHLVSTRSGWADRPLKRLLPTALAACLFLSGFGFLVVKTMTRLTNQWWLQNEFPGSGFEYTLGDGSVPGFFVLCAWMVIYYSWQAFTRIGQLELMQLRQDAAIKDSRLDAIATQLNPHFLFNSLNTVRGLIEESPASARDAVTHLAQVLRASLSSTRKRLIPLSEELETVHAHLMLESARHGSRLAITNETDPAVAAAQIPPLLLQTLVENAVKHGVAAHPGPGFVHYAAYMEGCTLKLVVRNSGSLAEGWDLPGGNGLGLIHTRERLALLFPGAASLSISAKHGVVTVETSIPQNKPATLTNS